ncbi:MAG: class I tRNA ligase family protein [Patescibacteria group bacterium]|nr:class I tRNA ligase family protein [Patescibacteria group bacterium]MDD4610900.1 class I tRNA ligase family protein [Patescibacteria group bacterium]
MSKELPKAYEPKNYEDEIYKKWEDSGLFNPDNLELEKGADYFSVSMPPPNVTGVLHLGHALENSLMDTEVRYQRMRGKKTLLVPGTDHAAVATQAKVEKVLLAEGIANPRITLGREKLLERVREYSENSKATIIKQIKKLGTSCDWSRLAYTFDEARSTAVNEVFIKMYNDGLVYKGYRAVNWSVKGQSTCSDDELVYVEQKTKLYTFKYSKDFPIAIATTRPETKLGDTAVAVNPKDKRYKKFIGKIFTVEIGAAKPLKIEIIGDDSIDMNFGTGAVGVTPAHSMIDFELFLKHNLILIPVIGADGRMTADAGITYQGLTVIEAREKMVAWLQENSLMEKEEEIIHSIGTSDRFGDVIEVIPMEQWFVNVNKEIPGRKKSLKELMREAVSVGHNGDPKKKIAITPDRFNNQYFHWIDNLRDWCISRQIWWGHRILVWSKSHNVERITHITYFVHGTTTDNEKEIATGWLDGELSDLGKKQAIELGEKIQEQKFDVVICSDLKRAVDSAKLMFGEKYEIITDKRLREANYGDYNGKKHSFKNNLTDYISQSFTNGENYFDVQKRITEFLSEAMDKYAGKKIAIVAHQAPQLALEVVLKGKSWAEAMNEDWRRKKAWQPGWNYDLEKLVYVSSEAPQGEGWNQDPDTLDTWFSSGLWTFSTLGWPAHAKASVGKPERLGDLAKFHPTSWMQMGYEILFFWMARMILMSTYVLNDIPFKNVYIHGILRDKDGRKFSKSLGNGIDPIEVINQYGADALRLSLILGITPGNDARFYEEKVEGARNFINKLWNISRYILSSQKEAKLPIGSLASYNLTLADRWVLGEMRDLIKNYHEDLENYRFSQAGERLREFTWNSLADWYLEASKFEKSEIKAEILEMILTDLLKLWHPFIPFVTEVIWQEINPGKFLMVEKLPSPTSLQSFLQPLPASPAASGFGTPLLIRRGDGGEVVAANFNLVIDIITAIRNARAENKVEPGRKIKAVIYAGKATDLLKSQEAIIKGLRTGIEELEIKAKGEELSDAIYAVAGGVEIYLIGAVDAKKEKVRIEKEVANLEKLIKNLKNKLANKEFVDKAPQEIVKNEKDKLENYRSELEKLEKQVKNL